MSNLRAKKHNKSLKADAPKGRRLIQTLCDLMLKPPISEEERRFDAVCTITSFAAAMGSVAMWAITDPTILDLDILPVIVLLHVLFVVPVVLAATVNLARELYFRQSESNRSAQYWLFVYFFRGILGGAIVAFLILLLSGWLFYANDFTGPLLMGVLYTLMGGAVAVIFWAFASFGRFRAHQGVT